MLNFIFYSRHDDLKQMLDSSKDGLKLEAMKRIIGVSLTKILFMFWLACPDLFFFKCLNVLFIQLISKFDIAVTLFHISTAFAGRIKNVLYIILESFNKILTIFFNQ